MAVRISLQEPTQSGHHVSLPNYESITLYSDAPADAAKAFGLAFKVDVETYEKLLGYGIDLEAASGQDHHILPVPAVFLIERDGKIDFRY